MTIKHDVVSARPPLFCEKICHIASNDSRRSCSSVRLWYLLLDYGKATLQCGRKSCGNTHHTVRASHYGAVIYSFTLETLSILASQLDIYRSSIFIYKGPTIVGGVVCM